MLELYGIKKDYPAGNGTVHALKGIDLKFRNNEFVSILGPSGCGKTTLLNIIGGLDSYTTGDLVIGGISTKEYKDRDWDSYRNHSIGFVFQTYNLIPHQTVLQNVEIALTLSGVAKGERRKRAIDALVKVGLADQINKRPSAMSGGQMQRVAIARALVNNPDIILADEPTGALDTETSVQVMEILKEVAKDRLVIMVTHNPELAERYSTRIIRMLDGNIIGDTAPFTAEDYCELTSSSEIVEKTGAGKSEAQKKEKKPSMSFTTAFMLSLKNLFTKKGRTLLTSFAGSIGIIGIALILAVSQGMTGYINYVQESTLSSYPLTLETTNVDITALINSFMSIGQGSDEHDLDAIYKDPIIQELVTALYDIEASDNDLSSFKKHLEQELSKDGSPLKGAISGIQYTYALSPLIYTKNVDGKIVKSDTGELMMEMLGDFMLKLSGKESNKDPLGGNTQISTSTMSSMMDMGMWQELLPGLDGSPVNGMIMEQYELIDGGSWPNDYNEIVLIVNKNNEIDDLTLYALGLIGREEIDKIIDDAIDALENATGDKGEHQKPEDNGKKKWTFEDIRDLTFRTILPADCYVKAGDVFIDVSTDDRTLEILYESATELKVTGIIRPKETTDTAMLTGSIGYTHKLTEYIIEESKNSEVIKAQLENKEYDVLTGLPFKASTKDATDEELAAELSTYVSALSVEEKAQLFIEIQCIDAEAANLNSTVEAMMSYMNDKDLLVAQISEAISAETGVDKNYILSYLEKMELDDLKDLLRPAIIEQAKQRIRDSVVNSIYSNPAFSQMTEAQQNSALAGMLDATITNSTPEKLADYYRDERVTEFSPSSYEEVLVKIGYVELDTPFTINIYATTFQNKDIITQAIADYNGTVDEAQKISYTDYMGILMSSVTQIIDAVTYVLIAFVAISLIVSSIMIGVITLISVQERTKEIGILRAIGASKSNVSSMFNAETLIIGFASGLLGILVTYLLCIPINIVLFALTGIANLRAILPIGGAVALVLISMVLTLIAGIIPSRSAAKKDPVVALRSE